MPKNIVQYDLLISCPGDITSEIPVIEDAVSQFNTQFSDALEISIRTKHWRKNSYAQSGGKPQALLNEQFVNDCDAAVAILWTRFGTPTDEYGSGTEEEVEIMLSSGKQRCTRGYKQYKETSGLIEWKECQIFHSIFT